MMDNPWSTPRNNIYTHGNFSVFRLTSDLHGTIEDARVRGIGANQFPIEYVS